ncbi:MAG: cupin domain-containing protein [Deltaproteobacteria bacterium]|nr:cupin domain-containing protein [Deltaproteobacteria bacterium]
MNDKVIVVPESDIPMREVPWGRTKVLVGKGEKAESSGFMFKITEYMPGHSHEGHTHTQDEVIFVLSGRGITELAEGKREVVPGDLVFVPAHVRHAIYNSNAEPLRAVIVKSPPDA